MDNKPVLRPYQCEMIAKLRAEAKSKVITVLPPGVGKGLPSKQKRGDR
jgi:superfamily II DNA or RNA helicase